MKTNNVMNTPFHVSKIGNNYDQYSVYDKDGKTIVNTIEGRELAELIAAAPETAAERDKMKEALKAVLAVDFDDPHLLVTVRKIARAALNGDATKTVTQTEFNKLGVFAAKEVLINAELLEALNAVYTDIDLDKHGSSELNIKVQAAIAHAEGKEVANG